jgi:putative ABC transport system permease protein
MDAFLQDLRYAVRGLRKTPSFATVAVLTLALGIGANTAIFSAVYGILLRPLPYRGADRLVVIEAYRDYADRRGLRGNYSLIDLDEWQKRSHAFQSIAMSASTGRSIASTEGAEMLSAAKVSDDFFSTLHGRIILGRPLGAGDHDSRVAVISERLWRRQFAASPDAVGRRITLDAEPLIVVGVADASLQFPIARTDVWMPVGPPGPRGGGGYNPIARLKDGVSIPQAQADVDEVTRELARAYPEQFDRSTALVVGLRDAQVRTVKPALLILFAAAGLVLMIACANLTNLFLARNAGRLREIAVRRALGASHRRLVAYALVESGLIAVTGCATGVLVAVWCVRVLVVLQPSGLPRLDAVHVDGPVLAFAGLLAIITSCAVGLLPVIQSSQIGVALRLGARTVSGDRRARRLRSVLVVAELMISVMLLVTATVLGRSLVRLLQVDIGVASDHVVALLIDVTGGRKLSGPQTAAVVDRVVERVSTAPGIQSASASASVPPDRSRFRLGFKLPDPMTGREETYVIDSVPATPKFFAALHIPLIRGRQFTDADNAQSAEPVMLMSAATARRFFGEGDPLGRTLPLRLGGGKDAVDVVLVGVVGEVKYVGVESSPGSTIYLPYARWPVPNVFLVARTATDPVAAVPLIRHEIAAVDPLISVWSAQTLDDILSEATAQPRFRTYLFGALAGLALMLAVVGLYGVVTYSVSQRTAEIGIRIALGADATDVTVMVIREAVFLAATGTILGVIGAYSSGRVLEGLLFGVKATDPVSFIAATCGLLAVSVIASYPPAWRAAHVDPMISLKAE